ncbi:MAG TPA: hydrolase [Candidatus Tumulicola sp.]|nr:hydrolase [Candidatus Tumulicola sp.]
MPSTILDPRTALVLIDLQKGVLAMPAVHDSAGVVENAARLARAFRNAGLPVVLVNVAFSRNGEDRLQPRSDEPAPSGALPADFSELVPQLGATDDDVRITKRQWGAFHGTELDLQLRRRGVTGIVLGGISTSIGVESTARSALEHGYNVTFAVDAMTDRFEDAHRRALERIFPRIGQVRTTAEILSALDQRAR